MSQATSSPRLHWLAIFAVASVGGCPGRAPTTTTADAGVEEQTPDAGFTDVLPPVVEGECVHTDASAPEFLQQVGCSADFALLASEPIDVTLPGARSTKVVLDLQDPAGETLWFQNSVEYSIHYEFASTHLSGDGRPIIGTLADFNTTEYYSPERRFLLGAVTHYEGPGLWALEVAPYDTMSAAQIAKLYAAVQSHTFFGNALVFHPTSENVATVAAELPEGIFVRTTDDIYSGIDYQPLSLATGVGRLRFLLASALDDEYVSFEDIVVLDEAPNDISVVQGLITEEFQTPLSHVNVLSQNRRTPNMGLRGALQNAELRALEGKLVELIVGASSYSVREVTEEEALAFWEEHRPPPIDLPAKDDTVTALVDIAEVTAEPADGEALRDKIKDAVNAFGGKAAHYSVLARTDGVPTKPAFAIPIFYYDQFMAENGFFARIDELLADPAFAADARTRDLQLALLRADMRTAPVDAGLQALLEAKLAADFPGKVMRFRTSTNSEDLDGFPCAGCYESHTGDPTNWSDVLDAITTTWASTWLFRTFEERTYYGVDHKSVGMALLVHENFADEEANGVATTSNPFDASGLDPAFYVNVQLGGDAEVVHPPPGVTTDQFLYYFYSPNQPVSYLTHSSLVATGETVLTLTQIHDLGVALDAIHRRFSAAYGPASGNLGFYAMDVELKFDDKDNPGEPPALYVKQARPYPGRQ